MIPNQWYAILESSEVKPGKPVGVLRMGEQLVAWRDSKGTVSLMSDLCPHRGVALSKGKIIGDCVQCPFHGFEFDVQGNCRLIPANGKANTPPKAFHVHTYPAREANGFIFIWWGDPQAEFPPLPWFDSVPHERFSWKTLRDHWAIHYSRAIENQLDVVHLPFIHYNTIGRGHKTVVNGPLTRVVPQEGCSDIIDVWVNNEIDRGQSPLRASQLPDPGRRPFVQFRFPNLWHNWISDQMHIVLAFAPIDENNTMMYIRMYQDMVMAPVLRAIFDWIGALGNLVIERQDKRVVETQRPGRTSLHMDEKLIQGDRPIVEYRRRRLQLQEEQNRQV